MTITKVMLLVHESLAKLKKMNIDYLSLENELVSKILSMPNDLLSDMSNSQIIGLVFTMIGDIEIFLPSVIPEEHGNRLFSFDMEVDDIDNMYAIFINRLNKLTKGTIVLSDVLEKRTILTNETIYRSVHFTYAGREYEFISKSNNDWFDIDLLLFINQILKKNSSEKSFYATGDHGQSLIIFYSTDEWAEEFNREFYPTFNLVNTW